VPTRDIIVIGSSSGGVEALVELVRGLPKGFPASIFVVCHIAPHARSVLPEILSRSGPVLAVPAVDNEPFYPGQIYVAPPDRHLLIIDGRMQVVRGPRENHHRPAIDPLFRSAARACGSRVVGVILSGGMTDGVAGLLAVRTAGGVSVVQDPRDAKVAALPQSATELAGADHIVPAAQLAPLLTTLISGPTAAPGGAAMSDPMEKMPEIAEEDFREQVDGKRRGQVSTFSCPECGGTLWQVDETVLVRFRCHIGHAYYGDTLFAEQAEALEAALWIAVRTFRERTVLARQMARLEHERGQSQVAKRYEDEADLSERYDALIRQYLLNGPGAGVPPGAPSDAAKLPEAK
jgi:two-component system chemotaxis response regulator CheB